MPNNQVTDTQQLPQVVDPNQNSHDPNRDTNQNSQSAASAVPKSWEFLPRIIEAVNTKFPPADREAVHKIGLEMTKAENKVTYVHNNETNQALPKESPAKTQSSDVTKKSVDR